MVVREDVIKRLTQLGYTATEADNDQIDFELNKTLNYVKNYCNITIIPEILDPRIVDRVCGEFLHYKKNSGSLTLLMNAVRKRPIKVAICAVIFM